MTQYLRLLRAIYNGDLDDVVRLRLEGAHNDDTIRNHLNEALWSTAQYGRVEILRELRENWGLDVNNARSQDNRALRLAAENGHINILRELREGFGLTTEDAKARDNAALRGAVLRDHVGVIGELMNGFNLRSGDPNVIDHVRLNNATTITPISGNPSVPMLIRAVNDRNFGLVRDIASSRTLTRQQIRDHNEGEAIWGAAADGNVEGLRELREAFGLTAEDARVKNNRALRWAAENGHSNVLRELREGYGLNVQDARSLINRALRLATEKNHLSVVRELRSGYRLNAGDARVYDNSILKGALERLDYGILDELKNGFGLTSEDAYQALQSVTDLNSLPDDIKAELAANWDLDNIENIRRARVAVPYNYNYALYLPGDLIPSASPSTLSSAPPIVTPNTVSLPPPIASAQPIGLPASVPPLIPPRPIPVPPTIPGPPIPVPRISSTYLLPYHTIDSKNNVLADIDYPSTYENDYRLFCQMTYPYSLGNLRKILDYYNIRYSNRASRAKLCRILYKEFLKSQKTVDLDGCLQSEDLVDGDILEGLSEEEVVKFPVKPGQMNCFKKNNLKKYLNLTGCSNVRDTVYGKCQDYFRNDLTNHPDQLLSVLNYNHDKVLYFNNEPVDRKSDSEGYQSDEDSGDEWVPEDF